MSSISTGKYINGRNLFLTTFDVNDWPDKPLESEVVYFTSPRYEQCVIGKDIFTKLGVEFTVCPIFKRTFGE